MARNTRAKYKNVEDMQKNIDKYFDLCDNNMEVKYNDAGEEILYLEPLPYTVTGLALELGFTSRQALLNYEGKKEFQDTIKKAKLKIENYAERKLYTAKNCTGVIFNLKNNYGWKDKTEQDVNMTQEIKVIPPDDIND